MARTRNSPFRRPKLGLGYGFEGINRLVNIVGPSFAKEIFFTARRFDAEEARMMGLVNRVVPADQGGAGRTGHRRDDRGQRTDDGGLPSNTSWARR